MFEQHGHGPDSIEPAAEDTINGQTDSFARLMNYLMLAHAFLSILCTCTACRSIESAMHGYLVHAISPSSFHAIFKHHNKFLFSSVNRMVKISMSIVSAQLCVANCDNYNDAVDAPTQRIECFCIAYILDSLLSFLQHQTI